MPLTQCCVSTVQYEPNRTQIKSLALVRRSVPVGPDPKHPIANTVDFKGTSSRSLADAGARLRRRIALVECACVKSTPWVRVRGSVDERDAAAAHSGAVPASHRFVLVVVMVGFDGKDTTHLMCTWGRSLAFTAAAQTACSAHIVTGRGELNARGIMWYHCDSRTVARG